MFIAILYLVYTWPFMMWQEIGCIMYDILREFLGHNFVSDLLTLKPKNLKKTFLKTEKLKTTKKRKTITLIS